jgi:hypothetical protein
MRRRVACAISVLFSIAMMSLLSCSQSSGGSDPEPEPSPPPASPSYGVAFAIDGQPYDFDKGFTETSVVPFGSQYGPALNRTAFFATPDIVNKLGDNFIAAYPDTVKTGEYDETNVGIILKLAGLVYMGTDFSLSITEYGAVGEAIAGTFSGTFKQNAPLGAPATMLAISDGVFRVLRVADGAFY